MTYRAWLLPFALALLMASPSRLIGRDQTRNVAQPSFRTSDRCVACHNGLKTPSGADVSIGFDWRASIMANSSRDPYWQASVRRESVDHPESQPEIEDECSICHMPILRYEAKLQGQKGEVFSHLPFDADNKGNAEAEDGVSCSVCHQISKEKLGTKESFTGGFVIDPALSKDNHPEYGPFSIDSAHQRIMDSSTGGFRPKEASHIRDSALCGTCHTLYTTARGPGGQQIGTLPEQTPYQEWLHSDYPSKSTCQSCHMPEFPETAPITAVLGVPRSGAHQHTFVAANFLMQRMLNLYRQDLSVVALPQELSAAADRTIAFLASQAARISISSMNVAGGDLQLEVWVQNLTGHKLPTAYPSRRAWIHLLVRDDSGVKIFESGALHADGSIEGNDNDADRYSFEPHYREITRGDQVEIYEDIMADASGRVTTGLLSAVRYIKDNRLLPAGFRKQTAETDISVVGDAAEDSNFTDAGDRVRYAIPIGNREGPFHVEAELWYQPIGFRWAHNLESYDQKEPRRFVSYYHAMSASAAVVLARTAAMH